MMRRLACSLLAMGLGLTGCGGGQGDDQPEAWSTPANTPDSFLLMLNGQSSLGAGEYQVVAATAFSGENGDYRLTITRDDGSSQSFSGSWSGSGSGGRDPDSPDNPSHTLKLDAAGGATISLESENADPFLYLVRNGAVVASDNDSGEGRNALLALPRSRIHNTEWSKAYYRAVDPLNQRTTLEGWKSANDFGVGDCLHVVFRDTKDLGYGRNMRACRKPGGDLAVMVQNYVVKVLPGDPDNYGPLNLDAALEEQSDHLLGTNAIEFTPMDPASPGSIRVAKFFTFNAAGQRIIEADLDGRGSKAMPQPCLVCHGASLLPLDADGELPEEALTSPKLNQLEVDSFEFADYGAFTRPDAEDELRRLNEFVHGTFQDMASRDDTLKGVWDADFAMEIAAGRYDNDFNSGLYNEEHMPAGWQQTMARPEGVELLYKRVVEPHCIACHSLRGSLTGERVTAAIADREGNAVNFSSYEKFIGYSDMIIDYVYEQGVMPLSLRNYNSFWRDPDGAPALLASFLPGFDHYNSQGRVVEPGLPVARTGASRTLVSPAQLDGSASLFADTLQWEVLQAPAGDWSLSDAESARPVLTAPTDGLYRLRLTASNDRGTDSAEVELQVNSGMATVPGDLTFTDHVAPVLQSSSAGTREACTNCHTPGALTYRGIPVFFTDSGTLYRDVMARVDLADPENSPLLRKPIREQHGGGVVIDRDDPDGRALYETLVNWIREGAVCGDASYCP